MKIFRRLLFVAICGYVLYVTTPPECRDNPSPPRYCVD